MRLLFTNTCSFSHWGGICIFQDKLRVFFLVTCKERHLCKFFRHISLFSIYS
uniref:Uncharacterized protein n=1 Tax=Populus trichocarpa TaxID=3694 RepID=A0A3N7FAM9_POPTR